MRVGRPVRVSDRCQLGQGWAGPEVEHRPRRHCCRCGHLLSACGRACSLRPAERLVGACVGQGIEAQRGWALRHRRGRAAHGHGLDDRAPQLAHLQRRLVVLRLISGFPVLSAIAEGRACNASPTRRSVGYWIVNRIVGVRPACLRGWYMARTAWAPRRRVCVQQQLTPSSARPEVRAGDIRSVAVELRPLRAHREVDRVDRIRKQR